MLLSNLSPGLSQDILCRSSLHGVRVATFCFIALSYAYILYYAKIALSTIFFRNLQIFFYYIFILFYIKKELSKMIILYYTISYYFLSNFAIYTTAAFNNMHLSFSCVYYISSNFFSYYSFYIIII